MVQPKSEGNVIHKRTEINKLSGAEI